MVKAHVRRKDSFSVERPLALENPEQQMILSALDIIGKPVPTWLKLVFDAENRLLNRIDFPKAYEFQTERRQWHIAELSSEEQKLVYNEAAKLPASSIEHLDIIVEEGTLV